MSELLGACFPVLNAPTGCAKWVRQDALDEEWAMRIHGQTLERLAQRHGLCPVEIMMNVKRLKFTMKFTDKDKEAAIALVNSIAAVPQGACT